MAKLTIPKRYQAGVSQIRKMPEETASEIRSALDQVFANQKQQDATVAEPTDIATTAITSLSTQTDDFTPMAKALAALYAVKSQSDRSVEEFVEDVCDAMESLDSEEKLPHAEREQFKGKLLLLLNADLFAVAAKAYDLKTDDERTFCHARILTDLRPVFGQRIEDGPKAMIVVHLLKLGFHQGSEKHQQFYISLDADDLEELRKVVDRAEAKAKTLRSTLRDIRMFGIS